MKKKRKKKKILESSQVRTSVTIYAPTSRAALMESHGASGTFRHFRHSRHFRYQRESPAGFARFSRGYSRLVENFLQVCCATRRHRHAEERAYVREKKREREARRRKEGARARARVFPHKHTRVSLGARAYEAFGTESSSSGSSIAVARVRARHDRTGYQTLLSTTVDRRVSTSRRGAVPGPPRCTYVWVAARARADRDARDEGRLAIDSPADFNGAHRVAPRWTREFSSCAACGAAEERWLRRGSCGAA